MKKYMLSELIKDGINALTEHGDIPVVIDVLTENQSNLFNPCHGLDVYHDKCYVTLELNDMSIKEFKSRIK